MNDEFDNDKIEEIDDEEKIKEEQDYAEEW
jgi:hypothetical protein